MTEQRKHELSEFDITVLVDKSGSMNYPVGGGQQKSRWNAMEETLLGLCYSLAKIDTDGIDIVFFSNEINAEANVTPDKIHGLFQSYKPGGSTALHLALEAGIKLAGKSNKPDLIIVFTDGVPDEKDKAAEVIRKFSHTLQKDEDCTFLFVQVGDDREATEYLQKLDDNLKGAKFDIVDTKTITEVEKYSNIEELLLDAIAG
jgi:uncharacterized protein with von Willebrand factor type A (vWA) domain